MDDFALIFNANNKTFVENLSPDDAVRLFQIACGGDDCLGCACFAWEFGEDKKVGGCICTLGGKASSESKGECPEWTKILQ